MKPVIDYSQAFGAYQSKISNLQDEIKALGDSVKTVNDQIKAKQKELNKLVSTLKIVAPELFPAKAKKGEAPAAGAEAVQGDEATGE